MPTLAIVCEELSEMDALYLVVVLLQRRPGGAHAQSRGAHRLTGRNCHLSQLALRSTALLESIQAIKSFQDLTKDAAPSSWSRPASASISIPAFAKLARTVSQSPPSGASMLPISP